MSIKKGGFIRFDHKAFLKLAAAVLAGQTFCCMGDKTD